MVASILLQLLLAGVKDGAPPSYTEDYVEALDVRGFQPHVGESDG